MIHNSTKALKQAFEQPAVLSCGEFRSSSRQLRQLVQRVSEQVSRYQQLLIDVEEDESDPLVRAKLESLRQTLRSLQRQHDSTDKALGTLAQTMASFEAEQQELVGLITKQDAIQDR